MRRYIGIGKSLCFDALMDIQFITARETASRNSGWNMGSPPEKVTPRFWPMMVPLRMYIISSTVYSFEILTMHRQSMRWCTQVLYMSKVPIKFHWVIGILWIIMYRSVGTRLHTSGTGFALPYWYTLNPYKACLDDYKTFRVAAPRAAQRTADIKMRVRQPGPSWTLNDWISKCVP